MNKSAESCSLLLLQRVRRTGVPQLTADSDLIAPTLIVDSATAMWEFPAPDLEVGCMSHGRGDPNEVEELRTG